MIRSAIACALSLLAINAAMASSVVCAPIAVTEALGVPGPMTISAAAPELGNPVLFWLNLENGHLQEHADQADAFISFETTLEIIDSGVRGRFVGLDPEQGEHYYLDMAVAPHPFYREFNGAMTSIGTCVASPMGVLPADQDAPIRPFPYSASGSDRQP